MADKFYPHDEAARFVQLRWEAGQQQCAGTWDRMDRFKQIYLNGITNPLAPDAIVLKTAQAKMDRIAAAVNGEIFGQQPIMNYEGRTPQEVEAAQEAAAWMSWQEIDAGLIRKFRGGTKQAVTLGYKTYEVAWENRSRIEKSEQTVEIFPGYFSTRETQQVKEFVNRPALIPLEHRDVVISQGLDLDHPMAWAIRRYTISWAELLALADESDDWEKSVINAAIQEQYVRAAAPKTEIEQRDELESEGTLKAAFDPFEDTTEVLQYWGPYPADEEDIESGVIIKKIKYRIINVTGAGWTVRNIESELPSLNGVSPVVPITRTYFNQVGEEDQGISAIDAIEGPLYGEAQFTNNIAQHESRGLNQIVMVGPENWGVDLPYEDGGVWEVESLDPRQLGFVDPPSSHQAAFQVLREFKSFIETASGIGATQQAQREPGEPATATTDAIRQGHFVERIDDVVAGVEPSIVRAYRIWFAMAAEALAENEMVQNPNATGEPDRFIRINKAGFRLPFRISISSNSNGRNTALVTQQLTTMFQYFSQIPLIANDMATMAPIIEGVAATFGQTLPNWPEWRAAIRALPQRQAELMRQQQQLEGGGQPAQQPQQPMNAQGLGEMLAAAAGAAGGA